MNVVDRCFTGYNYNILISGIRAIDVVKVYISEPENINNKID